jgi:hypothetical protein
MTKNATKKFSAREVKHINRKNKDVEYLEQKMSTKCDKNFNALKV